MNRDHGQLMSMFEELAEKMNIKIIQGKGNFHGGSCRWNEQEYIIVNKLKPVEQRLKVIAQAFSTKNLSDTYVIPVLRTYIEDITR